MKSLVVFLIVLAVLWLVTLLSVTHDAVGVSVVRVRTVEASVVPSPPAAPPAAPEASLSRAHETGPKRTLSSTAYCEVGRMANGRLTHDGAVSSKILPRGSRWRVLTGRFADRVFTVEDTGSLAFFDVSMPARCAEALAYGRQTIEIVAA